VESEVNVAVDAVAVGFNLLGESRLADGSAANIKCPLSSVSYPDPNWIRIQADQNGVPSPNKVKKLFNIMKKFFDTRGFS
jgi:hypothetical protein